jgi:hypothetical protein
VSWEMPTSKPLLCLHMMVKDEARRIKETLESVKPYVDSWMIFDTGSTDGTQALIKEAFFDAECPGILAEGKIETYEDTGIIDYAASRNKGLDFLKELMPETPIFILLLNGDDILKDGDKLRSFCEAHEQDKDEAYHTEIRGESGPNFIYPRLIRTSANWRYSMPTHEIICGKEPVRQMATGAWILKCNDPVEVRMARWKKDQIVLERYLKKHVDDHRALFYLAQTHECLSEEGDTYNRAKHVKQAIDLYIKRGGLGGWQDEAYESNFRAAKLMERLQHSWSEIQNIMLKAYSIAPYRAEPLAYIAQHWLDAGVYATAYVFASAAAEIPIPHPGPLNPENNLYEAIIPDLLSRAAYYIGKKEIGRKAAWKAFDRGPEHMKNHYRRNYAFYAHSAREAFPSFREKELIIPGMKHPYLGVNPSIRVDELGKRAIVRGVNFEPVGCNCYHVRDEDKVVRTQNWYATLDDDYNIVASWEIKDVTGIPRSTYPVKGFEDMRLFRWRGKDWASCTICDMGSDRGAWEIGLLELNDYHEVVNVNLLRGSWSKWAQKNWLPLVRGDQLFWVYSADPLHVIRHSDLPELKELPAPPPILRGSSPVITLPDGRNIWICHEMTLNGQGYDRIYQHRFVLANSDLTKVEVVSRPFHFHNEPGIEFCCGMTFDGENLIASYGLRDLYAMLGFIPLKEVLDFIEKLR